MGTVQIREKEGKDVQIARLAQTFRLADIYVFGSRAKEIAAKIRGSKADEPASSSDVDIAIRPFHGTKLSPRDLVNITIELTDLLGVTKVDLVLLPDCDPFLAFDIIRGELVHTADPVDQARYELFVLRRAGDLIPFKKERMELILEGHGR
jgi:predicted nucleotidyltransferase